MLVVYVAIVWRAVGLLLDLNLDMLMYVVLAIAFDMLGIGKKKMTNSVTELKPRRFIS